MNEVVSRLHQAYPDQQQALEVFQNMQMGIVLTPFEEDVVGSVAGTLWMLLGSVGILLLIACANLANLFLVRAENRRLETAVRTALGAGRAILARVFLVESTLLALAGGVGGLLLAYVATPAILALAPQGLPRMDQVGISGVVVGFSLGTSLLSCLLFSLPPVLQRLPDPAAALNQATSRSTGSRARGRARSLLAVAQVTLALVLMSGSGLLVRSFFNLQHVERGFDSKNVLTLRLPLAASEYPEPSLVVAFYDAVLNRIRAIPGVISAGAGSGLPYTSRGSMLGHTMEDFPVDEGEFVTNYSTQHIVPGFLESLGIPLVAGRMFDRTDLLADTRAVIVSAPLAERFWPGQSAIGRRLTPARPEDGNSWYEIVGVVGGVQYQNVNQPATEVIYYPLKPLRFATDADPIFPVGLGLVIKTAVPPSAVSRAVHDAIWAVNPNVPVTAVRSMDEIVNGATAQAAFSMLLILLAAATALVLGIVGLYGVISFLVAQRTREIGIRMALGASRGKVTSMVLRNGMALALSGVVLGMLGSLGATHLLRSFLFEVSPSDPTILGLVSVLLVAVSALATMLPARRAASVGPLAAIRSES
jgi:predicted permease